MCQKNTSDWWAAKVFTVGLFMVMMQLALLGGFARTARADERGVHPNKSLRRFEISQKGHLRTVRAALNVQQSPVVADAFDYPFDTTGAYGLCPLNVGSSTCYWRCRGFLDIVDNNCQIIGYGDHLGEDWNRGALALRDDYGDPVYAIANGEVVFAQSNLPIPGRPGHFWGKVIIVRHTLPDGTQVESQYAHLKDMYVTAGALVTRGQTIGTIGDAEGTYGPHLHFEIRYSNSRAWGTPGPAWSGNATGWAHPSKFINVHRTLNCAFTVGQGASGSELTAIQSAFASAGGQAVLGCALGAVQTAGFTSFNGTVAHHQQFANGEIFYHTNGSRAGQAFAIIGSLDTKWNSLGLNANHPLGYPTGPQSSRIVTCDGTAKIHQVFEGGSLEYHLTNQRAESVYEVHGAIYTKWVQKNAAQCPLGLPISDAQSAQASGATSKTGLVSEFQGGRIYWITNEPEAFATHGPIDSLYVAMGKSASWLGFPTSDQYVANGYDRGDFEGGYITTTDGINFQAFPHASPPAGADLSINATESSDPVLVNSNLTYAVAVTNNGPNVATGVTLIDSLPANVTFISAVPSQGACGGTSIITCDLGILPNGATATLSIVVKAKSVGTISNTITVRALEYDANSVTVIPTGNNAAILNTTAAFNQAPVVNAGADQSISLANTASLNGTASDDGLPAPPSLTTTWSKVSGPGTVTFANASALSTTATFTAAGSYVLRLTAGDGALSNIDEATIVVDPASGGLLAGNLAAATGAVDLSSEGGADWAHWGLTAANSFNHKSGIPQQISNYTRIGSGTVKRYAANSTTYTWSDGVPTGSATNTPTGIYLAGLNNGFRLTVPADTQLRTLKLYVGLWAAQGKLEVTLSDGSAAAYVDTTLQAADTANGIYTINYRAAALSGQVLTVRWTASNLSNTSGNVTLQAASLVINSGSTNQAPVVNAGADQSISLANTASLNGTASDDGLPAPPSLTTTWSKVSGPGTVTFANASALSTTATFTAAGSYVLRLTASDGALSGSDDIVVTVNSSNQTPTITNPGNQVNAEGNVTNLQIVAGDPDGDTLTYSAAGLPGGLTINSGTGQITGTLSFTSAGSHSVTVTVNDGRGGIANTSFSWTVSNTNQVPAVSLTSPVNGAVFTAPANIIINANASDSDGSVATVEFYSNGALIGTDQTAPYGITWSGVAAGSYSLTAIVTDDAGAATTSNAISLTVSVASSGLLSGSLGAAATGAVDLSSEGGADWAHWGLTAANSFNHKSGIPQQISNYTRIGSGTVKRYVGSPTAYTWSDGTPVLAATNTTTGLYLVGLNNGFRLTVPADTQLRTLKLYVGLWAAQGKLEVTLSDGSAPVYIDTNLQGDTGLGINAIYTINYRAASSGQVLTVRWTALSLSSTSGNVTLQAASLMLVP